MPRCGNPMVRASTMTIDAAGQLTVIEDHDYQSSRPAVRTLASSILIVLGCCDVGDRAAAEPGPTKPGKIPVIFDTDIDGDNDDVAAAAILHALADEGKVEILAMGVVSRHPYSPACLDAINTYYGRGDIPIGVYKGTALAEHGSPYAKVVAERCPNDVGLADKVPDVLGVYRRVLSGQPDGAVTMIAVGQMNNLVDLLASPPDEHSDLPGRELVRRKVAALFVMAPYFNERNEYQRAYNFTTSPKAAVDLVENWPTKIKFGEGNLGPPPLHRQPPERNPGRQPRPHRLRGLFRRGETSTRARPTANATAPTRPPCFTPFAGRSISAKSAPARATSGRTATPAGTPDATSSTSTTRRSCRSRNWKTSWSSCS